MDEGPLTIEDAARRMRQGELTPTELLEICLKRVDRYEPHVQAWAYLDRERARAEADQSTRELQAGKDLGALHGIPLGIKDIIDVADMPTGCGSKLWAKSYARQDAQCVKKLRAAGALILGKTVTTPYAYLDPPPTRNPWNRDRTPGGSSSGSAAAVACGMCLGALATQTGGSTIRPAAYCGVFAIKPTYGTIAVEGCLPLAPTLDHIGVMAKSAADLATILNVFVPPDQIKHPAHESVALAVSTPFAKKLDPQEHEHWLAVLEKLSHFGYQLVQENDNLESIADYWTHYRSIITTEASQFHGSRLARAPHDYGPEMTALIRAGQTTTPDAFQNALAECQTARETVSQRIFPTQTAAWLVPATLGPAPSAETTGDPYYNIPWSFCGLPAVSIPISLAKDGLPRAVQIVGRKSQDLKLLALADKLAHALHSPNQLPAW